MVEVKDLDVKRIARKGQRIYEEKLKGKLEPENNGKIVAIEVETGDYFIGETTLEACRKAKKRYPDKVFHSVRIGHKAVHSVRLSVERFLRNLA